MGELISRRFCLTIWTIARLHRYDTLTSSSNILKVAIASSECGFLVSSFYFQEDLSLQSYLRNLLWPQNVTADKMQFFSRPKERQPRWQVSPVQLALGRLDQPQQQDPEEGAEPDRLTEVPGEAQESYVQVEDRRSFSWLVDPNAICTRQWQQFSPNARLLNDKLRF